MPQPTDTLDFAEPGGLALATAPVVAAPRGSPFGNPRNFLDFRFVYAVISSRARGLSIGINMNPDRHCDFNCAYCEVNRTQPATETELNVHVMGQELSQMLFLVRSGRIREHFAYRGVSDELLELRHVAFSGDGEPTLCPVFAEAVEEVVHLRANHPADFFKLVLSTNGSGLDRPAVQESLRYFTADDEIWVKLEAGTQAYMDRVNRASVPLEKILQNLLALGRKRPVVIQSLFALVNGEEPPPGEIDQYIQRLNELKNGGARISLVQIYSATRPAPHSDCGHLPLRSLSVLRRRIKAETGLKAEVF